MNKLDDVFAKIMQHTYYFDSDSNEVNLTNINQRDWTGDMPIHIAVRLGDNSDILLLLDNGANVHATGERNLSALHYAAMKNDIDATKTLLDHGADTDCKDENGRAPIDWARAAGYDDLVSLLSKKRSPGS